MISYIIRTHSQEQTIKILRGMKPGPKPYSSYN